MHRRRFLTLAGAAILPRRVAGHDRPSVLVVGAGLAGLVAALELEQAGADVLVLEARRRAGGRVCTVRAPFAEGQYAEAGAVDIPDSHRLVRAQAERLGLRLLERAPLPELYHVHGRDVRPGVDPWPLDLTAEERTLGIAGMWRRYVVPALDEVGDPTAPGWPDASLARHDRISMGDLLRERGASPAAVTLLALGYLDLGGDGIETCSALATLRDLALRRHGRRSWIVEGGNDRLPAAMAARLGDRVRYGTPVVRLEPGEQAAAVVTREDGAFRRRVADHVVCTLPPPVLRRLEVAPPFSPARRAALAALDGTSLTRLLVQTRTRVWRTRGLPPSIVSDLPVKWVWDATVAQPGARSILDAHVGGADARRLAALTPPERAARILARLDELCPGVEAEAESTALVDWGADPWARGAYAWFRPGQLTALVPSLLGPEGRVHLAGEHTASASGWMQGALESGVRAAREVLARSGLRR